MLDKRALESSAEVPLDAEDPRSPEAFTVKPRFLHLNRKTGVNSKPLI